MSNGTLTGPRLLVLLGLATPPAPVGPQDPPRPDIAIATRILARATRQAQTLDADARHARNQLQLVVSAALADQARRLAARGELLAALERYAQADDGARSAYWRTIREGDWGPNEALGKLVLDLLCESDLVATRAFTPDFIERRRWRNLLGEQRAWATRVFGEGEEEAKVTFAGPALRVEMPGPERPRRLLLLSVAANEALRDIVVDMQVTAEGVGFEMGLRRDRDFGDDGVQPIRFTCNDERTSAMVLAPGKTHDVVVSLIGSELRVTSAIDGRDPKSTTEKVRNFRPRAGGIELRAYSGARFTITRLRIKDLRGG